MRLLPILAGALLVAPAAAQGTFPFVLDSQASSFTWSGTTSIGPIVGNPDTFVLVGDLTLELSGSATQAVDTLRLLSADALVTPDIQGEIPNVLPFLPPLATVSITNLRFSASSPSTAVAPGGAFSAQVVLTALSGTITVTPLTGSPSVQDLTGSQSSPTQLTGTLVQSGATWTLDAPLTSVFSLDDPTSGVSADVTLTGDIVADLDCPAPVNTCTTSPNSVGAGAVISWNGSTSLFASDLELVASGLPAGQPGVFYFGPLATSQPFGNGVRCVGGSVVRLSPDLADGSGVASRALDLAGLPLTAGSTRYFQFWYRDPAAGGAVFNLTDALEVFLCP